MVSAGLVLDSNGTHLSSSLADACQISEIRFHEVSYSLQAIGFDFVV